MLFPFLVEIMMFSTDVTWRLTRLELDPEARCLSRNKKIITWLLRHTKELPDYTKKKISQWDVFSLIYSCTVEANTFHNLQRFYRAAVSFFFLLSAKLRCHIECLWVWQISDTPSPPCPWLNRDLPGWNEDISARSISLMGPAHSSPSHLNVLCQQLPWKPSGNNSEARKVKNNIDSGVWMRSTRTSVPSHLSACSSATSNAAKPKKNKMYVPIMPCWLLYKDAKSNLLKDPWYKTEMYFRFIFWDLSLWCRAARWRSG